MARPKSTAPIKGRINLTVSDQTRLDLAYIADHTGCSISQLVADWAAKDARKISRQTGKPAPDARQVCLDMD